MALNPDLVQFFINQIQNAGVNTFKGAITQLFEHLENEIKDNPIFDKYQSHVDLWKAWPGDDDNSFGGNDWELPGEFEKVKELTFSLYKIASKKKDVFDYLYNVTGEGNYRDALYEFNKSFLGYLTKALDDIVNANPEIETSKVEKVSGNTVFIIHGHNELLKIQVQLLLTKAGVPNLVLHEQPDRGRTIIDKLVDEGKHSNFAIALLTADDKLENGRARARQNVILEIGYFMGQLGKERVRLLVSDDVEIPSDLHGILYEKYDQSNSWKMKLLKELSAAGIYVDFAAVVATM